MNPFAIHHPDDEDDNLMIHLTGKPMEPKAVEEIWVERNDRTSYMMRFGHLQARLDERLAQQSER